MIASNCPRCGETFRIPAGHLPEDAYARCPWCLDTFPIAEVLQHLPPVLELVSADGQPLELAPQVAAVQGAQADDDDDGESPAAMKTVVEDVSPEEFDLGLDSNNANDGPSAGHETVANETVEEDTFIEHPWGDADGVGLRVNEEFGHFVNDSPSDPQPDQPAVDPSSHGAVHSMDVSPAKARRRKPRGNAGIRMAIGVVLGGVMAFPIADGLLVLAGHRGLGLWRTILGSSSTPSSSGSNTIAAAPMQLQEDTASASGPGKPLEMSTDLEVSDEDPATAALEQLAGSGSASDLGAETSPPTPDNNTAVEQVSAIQDSTVEIDEKSVTILPLSPVEQEPTAAESPSNEPPASQPPRNNIAAASRDADAAVTSASTATPPATTPGGRDTSGNASRSAPVAAESRRKPPAPTPTPTESPELLQAATLASKAIKDLPSFAGTSKERPRLADAYRKITVVCELAEDDSKTLRELASIIKKSPNLSDLESAGAEWLEWPGRKTDGIALIGDRSTGTNTITLDTKRVISVTGDSTIPSSNRLLIMGRVVDESTVRAMHIEPLP